MSPLWLWVGAAGAHVPVLYFAGPTDDWCGVLAETQGSDVLMLSGGEYRGPCELHANPSDLPGEQTTVQSLDPLDPAVFVGSDADFVLRTSGESLLLLELTFRDLPDDVDAVRIGDTREVAVRRVSFRDLAGGGVVQDGPVEAGLVVSDSEFLDVARPVTIGCGGGCQASRVEVSENLVLGAGAGIVAGGGGGLIIDNVLSGVAEGIRIESVPSLPALRAARAPGAVEVVGNLVDAVGPAIVAVGAVSIRANVAMGAPTLSFGPDGLAAGNTLVGDVVAEVGASFVDNAVLGPDPGVDGDVGTVVCDASCFVDGAAWDFFPAVGSPLRAAGTGDAAVGRDWCGRIRADPPSVGAIEAFGDASFGPLAPTFKDAIDCALPVGSTGATDTTETPTGPTEPGTGEGRGAPSEPRGCGCGGGPAGGSVAILLVALWGRVRCTKR